MIFVSILLVVAGLLTIGYGFFREEVSREFKDQANKQLILALEEKIALVTSQNKELNLLNQELKDKAAISPETHFLTVLETYATRMNNLILNEFPQGITAEQLDQLGQIEAQHMLNASEHNKEALPQILSNYYVLMMWRLKSIRTQFLKKNSASNKHALN